MLFYSADKRINWMQSERLGDWQRRAALSDWIDQLYGATPDAQ
jgi:hypothetical protein